MNWNVRSLGKLAITVVLAVSWTAQADFGTKFACCDEQQASCLNGGGQTVWTLVRRGRAVTQIDAKKRCPFDRMEWNTHQCPKSTPCPEDVE